MTDIRKKYGYRNGIFNLKIEAGKEVRYNKNTFKLRLWGDRLHLVINGKKQYHWNLDEFSKKSKISVSKIKDHINQKKMTIVFNIKISKGKPKDHGTIIRLYN